MLRICQPFVIRRIAIWFCLAAFFFLPLPVSAQLHPADDVDVEAARTIVDDNGVLAKAVFANFANSDRVIIKVATPFAFQVQMIKNGKNVRYITLEEGAVTDIDENSFRLIGIKGRMYDGMRIPITFFFRNGQVIKEMFEVEVYTDRFSFVGEDGDDGDDGDEAVEYKQRKPKTFWQRIFTFD